MDIITEIVKEHIFDKNLHESLGIDKPLSKEDIKKLIDKGLIYPVGMTVNKKYVYDKIQICSEKKLILDFLKQSSGNNSFAYNLLSKDEKKQLREKILSFEGVENIETGQNGWQIVYKYEDGAFNGKLSFNLSFCSLEEIENNYNYLKNKYFDAIKERLNSVNNIYDKCSDEEKIKIKPLFEGELTTEKHDIIKKFYQFSKFRNKMQERNLYLYEDFFKARERKRKIICHLGPTNSGKTYDAMNTLMSANNGVYLAPLRLLAMENYDRMITNGIKAELVTGEEHIGNSGTHISSTIEMMREKRHYEVAVIDEIQMIADKDRGWAWTKALIGVNADVVYVCGSESALPMIKKAVELTGDELVIRKFERKSPLSFCGTTKNIDIKNGDAVICFSRKSVYEMAEYLKSNGHDVIALYGAMAPEIRRKQAAEFAKGESVLVCTDVIGMGMNLPIKRVLFSVIEKFNGEKVCHLESAMVKQIAGRAGRYGLHENGEYGTFQLGPHANGYIKKCMEQEETLKQKLPIQPHWEIIEAISNEFDTTNIKNCFSIFKELVLPQKNYKTTIPPVDILENIDKWKFGNKKNKKELPLKLKYEIYPCPLDYNGKLYLMSIEILKKWAGNLLNEEPFYQPDFPTTNLQDMETKLKYYDAYGWMCRKFNQQNFLKSKRQDLIEEIEFIIKSQRKNQNNLKI